MTRHRSAFVLPRCALVSIFLLAAACGDSGAGAKASSSAPSGLGSAELRGRWSYRGDGWAPEGQPNQHKISNTYTFLGDGTYVLEARSEESGSTTHLTDTGKWDLHPDSIVLVRQRRQFSGGANEDKVATSKIDAKISADGKELTLHGEDGDCPGSDCTRAYTKK